MASSFTPELKKLLLEANCYFERHGKGEHEIWYSPITERRFVVDNAIKSRHTALDLDEDGQLCSMTIEHAKERVGIPEIDYQQIAA